MAASKSNQQIRKVALEALGSYQKRGAISDDIGEMADLLVNESARGVVVILGSLIEDLLLERLMGSFVSLTDPQKKNLIRGGGLLGTFEHRITLAHTLGIIDQNLVEMLQVVKAMRNACAHSRLDIGFETPELHAVLALLFEGQAAKAVRESNHPMGLRMYYIVAFVFISDLIKGVPEDTAHSRTQMLIDTFVQMAGKAAAKHQALRERRKKQRESRPHRAPKG